MKKVVFILIGLIFVVIISIMITNSMKPKPYRWEETYLSYDKQPYGGYVFFDQLKEFFPGSQVKRMGKDDLTLYQTVDYNYYNSGNYEEEADTAIAYQDVTDSEGYLPFNFVGLNYYFSLNDIDTRSLLQHLYQGNHALIAAQNLEGPLKNYLGLELEYVDLTEKSTEEIEEYFQLGMEGSGTTFKPYDVYTRISTIPDSAEVILTGVNGDTLGVRFKVGNGALLYLSMPIIFSNYYLLKSDRRISASLLKMLPNRDTYWANRFVGGIRIEEDRSLLGYIHSQEALTWAYYLLLFSVLAYFGLQIKRRERPVSIVKPLVNDSLKFVDSISNLYFLKRDHKKMMEKKMMYFLERIRLSYHLDTSKIDEEFKHKLSVQSKVPLEKTKNLFKVYENLKQKENLSDLEFLRFNKLLQNFK